MLRETREYTVIGGWNRQKELLEEARRLHVASRAVREARAAKAGKNGLARLGVARHGAAPGRVGTRRAGHAARPSRSRPVWRTAAARMGTSLVAVGKRLEHLGRRARD